MLESIVPAFAGKEIDMNRNHLWVLVLAYALAAFLLQGCGKSSSGGTGTVSLKLRTTGGGR